MEARVAAIVELCHRHAVWVVLLALALSILGGVFTARHLQFDSDLDKIISTNVPWRQRQAEMDRAFPQYANLLAIVIDAKTPDLADDAADTLAKQLTPMRDLFGTVREPEGGPFFHREGLLFLPTQDVQKFADQMIAAQPLIGTLAADPSLRGVFGALDLLAQGAGHGDIDKASVATPFGAVADAVAAALEGRYAPLSWQTLLSGRTPDRHELRRFVLTQPLLDYKAFSAGERVSDTVRREAVKLGLTPARGVTVRITGPVPLSYDQLATLQQGAAFTTALSLGLLCLLLLLGLRSVRLVGAILLTLMAGLVACGAFAVGAVGPLNPISAAFAVLFVGLAVDFGIQFSIRYRDERFRADDLAVALRQTARGIGGPLAVAAAATSVGFLSFVPTDYTGVSELGLIAGVGMLVALVLNFTLLPALLTVFRPAGEPHPVGFARAAGLNRLLVERRRSVLAVAAAVGAVAAVVVLIGLRFDFNPLDLQSQQSEAMQVLNEMKSDPIDTPYTIEMLTPTTDAASALAARLAALPEVGHVVTVASFVPEDQPAKLAILADAATLLGPTLAPPQLKPPPSDTEILSAIATCAKDMRAAGTHGIVAATRLADLLDQVVARGTPVLASLADNLSASVSRRLDELNQSLAAQPVTLATLPDEIKRDWIAPDGRARIEVFPKGGTPDNASLHRFSSAVLGIAPDATGSPVTIQASADTVTRAFTIAGAIAVAAIAVLLFAVLRRPRDVASVLVPLALAGVLTLATSTLVGMPLNFANIITLPLLLGIGVAFDIYFVMRWRAGHADLLQSSTAQAILFSALTTGTAFGSLALSNHPGTADMGKLLTIALAYTLLCTFIVLPALLGSAPDQPSAP